MFCPEEMKANRLVQVSIPSGKDIYKSFNSQLSIPPESAYTGDNSAQFSRSKIQEIEDIQRYDEMKQREEMASDNNK